jgi:hypothetical protein
LRSRAGTLQDTQPISATTRHHRFSILAADAVVGAHLLFVAFLLVGGFLAWWWPAAAVVHILALVVSATIYLRGYDCPLTNLEKHLRTRGGGAVYPDGFIAHYLVRPVSGAGMTPALGFGLVVLVVGATLVSYGRNLL